MRVLLIAALVIGGCAELEDLQIPDYDGGLEDASTSDSETEDSSIGDAAANHDGAMPTDGHVPPPDGSVVDSGPTPCDFFAWPDADGDGFGDENAEPVEACNGVPAGYVTNADDCYDGNANARPGQTAWFAVHRGDGSFDYDCDGDQEKRYTVMGSCPELNPDCPPPNQWPSGFECDYLGTTEPGRRGWFRDCLSYFQLHGFWQCAGYEDVQPAPCGATAAWKHYDATCVGSPTMNTQECR